MKSKVQWLRRWMTLRVRGQLILVFAVCVAVSLLITGIGLQWVASQVKGATDTEAQYDSHALELATLLNGLNDPGDQRQVQKLLDKYSHFGDVKRLEVLVVDLQGRVVARSENMTEREVDLFDFIGKAMKQLQNAYQTGSPDVRFHPVQTLGIKGYLLVRGYPQVKSYFLQQWNLIALLCFFVPFFLLFFLLTRGKIGYLEELANGLLRIARGNLDHRVPEKSRDELGSLAKHINFMAGELQLKIEEERRIEQVKNELITNVSHDLRTPLTSIMGYLRLLRDQHAATPDQREEYIRIAYNKSEQLQSLMEDLFEYVSLNDPGVHLEKADVCINDLLKQLLEEVVPLAESYHVQLQLSMPEERIRTEVDPDKTVRVLENLLSNAVKYSDKPGTVHITLNGEGDGILISIRNRAKSIPAEEIPRLFERFYRVDKSRSKATPGTGLGLAIAKSIVDLHGGKIWADRVGEDILFSLWLPEK